ncbi:phage protein [Streptococcus pneumoniae]|uniref:Phage protein n=1 Tax=Streptococcus pneumoniae TaxID=1313 RepID=A0A4J1XU57_STREE|nr:phage protein [Streptococcus pneumoniae]VJL63521.1 phage protein [Streptococcus pneumoniae]VJN85593.1 phage protein [Streptococcus pneumoniae]VJR12325.1 phage protein [Streptococcus pneumoniae]VJT56275.1 phage protein [Streptococcus pneumoniae]
MNKDLIETPRFNFFIGDEVLLKGKIVGFDVDENKCVENVVRLEYGQTLNVANNNIYITDDIVDKSKIKVVVPQCVAEYIEFKKKNNFHVYGAMRVIEDHYDKKVPDWFYENNIEKFCLAWLNGYEVEKEKRYFVKIKGNIKGNMLVYGELLKRYFFTKNFSLDNVIYSHTRKELEDANFGWVFDCSGIEIEEVEYDTNA